MNPIEEVRQKVYEAYRLIQDADTNEMDAFYLTVEEAQGFIAEALDILEAV